MLASPRLVYRRLTLAGLDQFHALIVDDHVRRYMLDGALHPREWSAGEIESSDRLFAELGVGLWLVAEANVPEVTIGFCGYRIFEEDQPEPQLIYALREGVTGRGYATEIAAALVAVGSAAGLDPIYAAVDEINAASVRVLAKVGFEVRARVPGAFGAMLLVSRRAAASPPG